MTTSPSNYWETQLLIWRKNDVVNSLKFLCFIHSALPWSKFKKHFLASTKSSASTFYKLLNDGKVGYPIGNSQVVGSNAALDLFLPVA